MEHYAPSHLLKAGTCITYTDFAPAARIVKKISADDTVGNYCALIDDGNGQMQPAILRVFDAEGGLERFHAACRALTELLRSPAKEYVPEFSTGFRSDGTGFILIRGDQNASLSANLRCGHSLPEQLAFYRKLASALETLARSGVLLPLNPRYILQDQQEQFLFWNLDDAVPAEQPQIHQKNMDWLAKQLYYAITQEKPVAADVKSGQFEQSDFVSNVTQALCAELAVDELDLLLEILRKCLQGNDRYSHIGQLVTELQQLEEQIQINRRGPRAVQDRDFAAADFLYRNPLHPYVCTNKDGKKELNVVMVGDCPMQASFFEMIFSSAQMLDTQLRIHVLSANAIDFFLQLAESNPLLPAVTKITLVEKGEASVWETPWNEDVADPDKPFAELIFEQPNHHITAKSLLQLNPSCVLLMRRFDASARKLVKALADQSQQPLLIGVGTPQMLERSGLGPNRNVNIRVFSRRGACVGAANKEQTDIYKMALAVHTYYAKGVDERESMEKIRSNFQDAYSQASSIRSALAITYKLAACGLTKGTHAAQEFYDRVLSPQRDQSLRQRLLWLEHRSWQAFLIIHGCQLLSLKELEDRVLHSDNYDHRSKLDGRLVQHACLYSSSIDQTGQLLSQWSFSAWDKAENIAQLDKLDALSVALHGMLNRKVKLLQEQGKIAQQLAAVETALGKKQARLFRSVRFAVDRLLAQEQHAQLEWQRVSQQLCSALPGDARAAELVQTVKLIISSLQHRDFKESDLSVLEAIPGLILETPIQTVYKLCAEHPWSNVASSVFIEPEQLILVSDPEHSIAKQQINGFIAFFSEKRKLTTGICQVPMDAIVQLLPNAVLDVTGASAHQILAAQQNEALQKLPVIEYRNGELINPDRKYPQIHLYARKRSLTVEETLSITGSDMAQQGENPLLHAAEDSARLWRIVQTINGADNSNAYNDFSSVLSNKTAKDVTFFQQSNQDWRRYNLRNMDYREAADGGIISLLNQMEALHLIEKLPKWGSTILWDDEVMRITAASADIYAFISKILNTAKDFCSTKFVAPDRFQLLRVPAPGNPDSTQIVFRDTCMQYAFKVEKYKEVHGEKVENKPSLEKWKEILVLLAKEGFICPLSENKPLYQEAGNNALWVQFAFVDARKRDLIIKEGNVLEAFAYHTIRQANLFDDVKLGVNVRWAEGFRNFTDTDNEIDIIGTKGVKSYFISCKKCAKLQQHYMTEIRYETDHFGVDGTAILLTTAKPEENQAKYVRAQRMGVKIITLQDFQAKSGEPEDSGKTLLRALQELLPREKAF